MTNCTRCWAPLAPNSRFCTECRSTTAVQINCYAHHPARGLVQIGSTSVPPSQ